MFFHHLTKGFCDEVHIMSQLSALVFQDSVLTSKHWDKKAKYFLC